MMQMQFRSGIEAQTKGQNSPQLDMNDRMGDCPASTFDAPVYTQEVIDSLMFMIEEEKLAGDLYEQFYAQTGLSIFGKIAESEDRHMDALIDQALLAGIDVSGVISLPSGEYLNEDLQTMYGELLAAGSVSSDAALMVGQQVEQVDIADLEEIMITVVGTPLETIYSNLESGSAHHLAAFDYWLAA